MKNRNLIKTAIVFLTALTLHSCYDSEKKCTDFKNGKFNSETVVDGKTFTSTFERKDSILVETFNGVTDSYHVRWINDCEYILKNVRPKNMAEQKGVHIKILNTTSDAYVFEYSYIGDANKQKGKATKVK